jgi:hypothetical protein
LATAASSRGFSPTAERTFYPALRMTLAEGLVLGLLVASVSLVLLTKLLFWSQPGWLASFPALAAAVDRLAHWL